MPGPQAVNELAGALTTILNSSLPTTDTSLPQDTQNAINDAMNQIRDKNYQMAQQIATAINAFVRKSTVRVTIPYTAIRDLLFAKLHPNVFLSNDDVIAATSPTMVGGQEAWMPVNLGGGITLETTGGQAEISQTNAII